MANKAYAKMSKEQKQKMFKKQNERRKNPAKKAKSIPVAYRLSPFVIGRAFDGLKSYNGNFETTTISKIIKEVFFIGLNNITSHLPDGKVSTETKIDLTELSKQIHMDDMENLTTRTETKNSKNTVKNSAPNNCDRNLFKSQAEALLADRKYKDIDEKIDYDKMKEDKQIDPDKQQQMEEQTARENEEFMKRLKAGEIE